MEDPESVAHAAGVAEGLGTAPVVLREDDEERLEVVHEGEGSLDVGALVEQRLGELVDPRDRTSLLEARAAAREGRMAACQARLTAVGGAVRWFELRFLPGVAPSGLLVLLRDVTHLRRLAAEAAVLRRITELANSVTDADEVIQQAVADLRATLEWRVGRVLRVEDGQLVAVDAWTTATDAGPMAALLGEAAPEGSAAAVSAVERAVPVVLDEVSGAAVPSSLREAAVAAVVAVPVVADEEVTHVLEFHAAGDALLDGHQRGLLEKVGRQLGWVVLRERYLRELEASHAELARSNAELERFAYVASHDLQEPLRKIIGFTELLQDHHEPLDDDEAEYRKYVVDSAHRLQRLIKDLLAYSRAGRRQLAADPVDLAAVVEGVLGDLAPAIEEAGATVDVGDLPVVRGDEGQLREVLQNLVSNALKYRAEERAPMIRITEAAPTHAPAGDEETAHVVVADNGIGIDADQREAVFEVFRRLHPAHLYGGTGLGLALVQRIVARHGGSVSIDDSPFGAGIAVHLQLPLSQEQQ